VASRRHPLRERPTPQNAKRIKPDFLGAWPWVIPTKWVFLICAIPAIRGQNPLHRASATRNSIRVDPRSFAVQNLSCGPSREPRKCAKMRISALSCAKKSNIHESNNPLIPPWPESFCPIRLANCPIPGIGWRGSFAGRGIGRSRKAVCPSLSRFVPPNQTNFPPPSSLLPCSRCFESIRRAVWTSFCPLHSPFYIEERPVKSEQAANFKKNPTPYEPINPSTP
jgi:hypothetical protein